VRAITAVAGPEGSEAHQFSQYGLNSI